MVPSGSLTPSIDPAGFCLPAGTALRYERPADALRSLVPSYAVLDSDPTIFKGPHSWVLPGWPQLWIGLTTGKVTVQTRKRQPNVLGTAMLFGGTSCAMPTTSQGGVTVVIDLTPAGWARWFNRPADGLRDQIVPLEQLWSMERTGDLVARLHASDQGEAVKSVLDEFLLSTLPPPHHGEAFLTEIVMKVGESGSATAAETAVALGVSSDTLLRVTKRYFGYPMKVLTRRTRFLRVISEMLMTVEPVDHGVTPPGYHNVSHFLRDAGEFLGMTPRRFLALQMPYLRAVLRARTMVIGAPLPLLDSVAKP
jgi:AraC-like DNA-binding protein